MTTEQIIKLRIEAATPFIQVASKTSILETELLDKVNRFWDTLGIGLSETELKALSEKQNQTP